jgi:hypothetical protein
VQTALSPLPLHAFRAWGRRRIGVEGEAVLKSPIRLQRAGRSAQELARLSAPRTEPGRRPACAAGDSGRRPNLKPGLWFVAFVGLCLGFGGQAIAGSLGLGLQMGTSFYQHSDAATSPLQFQGRSLEPVIRFDRENGRSHVQLEARRRFDLYSGAALPEPLGSANQISDHAALRLHHDWSERDRFDADGSFLRSRDVLDIDRRTLALQSEAAEWGSNVSANLGRLEGAFHARGWTYDDPQLVDAVARNWSGRFFPVQRTAGAWFLDWHQRELVQGTQTALASRVAAIGFRRGLGPGASAEVEAGASRVTYADGGRSSGAEAALGISSPTEGLIALSAQLQFESAFPATLQARASTRVANGRLWLSGQSLVDAAGGFYRYPTSTRSVGMGFADTLGRATVIGLEANRASLRPFQVSAPTADVFQTSAWLVRRMRPWLSGRLGCAYLSQNGDGSSSPRPFRRMRVDATVTVLSW